MAWTEVAKLDLAYQWLYTPTVEGSFFKITHLRPPSAGKFLLSQFDAQGERFSSLVMSAQFLPEIIFLPTPSVFNQRKVGLQLIEGIPWSVLVEVSDYVLPDATVDLSPLTNQLNSIAAGISEVQSSIDDIPTVDLAAVNSKLDAIITKLGSGRETISITTPPIAPGVIHNTTIALGKAFLLLNITTSSPAWVRLYTSPAYRSADANRAITQNPANTPNGIISEDITVAGNLTIDLNGNGKFQGIGSSQESPPNGNIAIAIVNTSNTAQNITVSYNRILLESWA